MASATDWMTSDWLLVAIFGGCLFVEAIKKLATFISRTAAGGFPGGLADQDLLTGCGCLVEGGIDEKDYLRRDDDLAGDGVGADVLAEDDKRLSRVVYLEIET